MPDAAARILVHDLDQLLDRVLAVAHHVSGRAARGGDELAVDHQQAVIVSFEEALDDHRAGVLARHVEAVRHLLVGGEADGNATAVVAVVGLGHHREADAARGAHRLGLALHQLLLGHRQPQAGEDLVGLLLVAGELDRDVRGAAGDRRPDALLVLAVAELNERLVVEAQPGDAARFGGAHQGCRGGPERAALREADELVARLGKAPALGDASRGAQPLGQQRADQPQPELAGRASLVALRVLVDDRIHPGGARAARLAERDRLARDVLQLDRHVLEDVPEPGALALAHAPVEAAGLAVGATVLGEPGQRLAE